MDSLKGRFKQEVDLVWDTVWDVCVRDREREREVCEREKQKEREK